MKLLYFAWVRERIGVAEENIHLPDEITCTESLITWLCKRSDGHALALGDNSKLRIAVNQDYIHGNKHITNDDEIAIFPPVTGG